MSADPARYVPRIAAESVLARLQEHVEEGGAIALLLGPPGIGKTMLLQVLQARLHPQRRCVYVPHAAVGSEAVSAWILGWMGEPAGDDPDAALAALAERHGREGARLVLLVDEAASLAPEAAARLAALARRGDGASLVLAGIEDSRMRALRAALGRDPLLVRYDEPMSPEECARHARALLARDARPAWRDAKLDDAALGALFRASGGNPAILEELVERRAWESRDAPL